MSSHIKLKRYRADMKFRCSDFEIPCGTEFTISSEYKNGNATIYLPHTYPYTIGHDRRRAIIGISTLVADTSTSDPPKPFIPKKIGTEDYPDPHEGMVYNPYTEKWSWI